MIDIKQNIEHVFENIRLSSRKVGRNPDDIELIAVTKYVDIERIKKAYNAGLKCFGENYVQEAKEKIISLNASWHFIGRLQRNKINQALSLFDMIQSVDSFRLARSLNQKLEKMTTKKSFPVLLEINCAEEISKAGFKYSEINEGMDDLLALSQLKICGLMAIPPNRKDPEENRVYFKKMYELKETLTKKYSYFEEPFILSMGMSHDYQIAIEEGSTMVRIGTAIFGERPHK